ncbi:MAG: glycoside hydrolase family 71/99-like protein [Pirellulales bacterium]
MSHHRRIYSTNLLLATLTFLAIAIVENNQCAAKENVLRPYDGPSVRGVDTSTLTSKVMTGYQGWFNCPGDGADLGWVHWGRNRKFAPGNNTVDIWPDMSELGQDEKYATGFHHADGRVAEVFSSYNKKTVLRHFQWMQDYGIDGAFVQRFANGLRSEKSRHHKDVVLSNARAGANQTGRAYAVMYDLTSLPAGGTDQVRKDWLLLQSKMQITKDSAYLHHEGNPVVAVWGIAFNDGNKPRKYSLSECKRLVIFLKEQGCTVMLGVPTGWRNLDRDCLPDPEVHEVLKLADIVSPWTIGRYRTPKEVVRHADNIWQPDNTWCKDHDLDYLPVLFPGFSWHHLTGDKLDAIPRLKGKFLWSQIVAAKRAGCDMLYVAMFDEVDEGTAIFKCTNQPPTGDGVKFLTYEGLPSDYYLRLTGMAGKIMRGEMSPTDEIPIK